MPSSRVLHRSCPLEGNRANSNRDRHQKPGGLGQDGTIPPDPNGVAAGHTGTASTFEPEEDEKA